MKDFLIVVVIVLAAAGWAFFVGHSHSIKFRYDCGIEVPWYEAIFLDTERCPGTNSQP